MKIYKCLALYFHHDSPWSNDRMIVIKCWVENGLRWNIRGYVANHFDTRKFTFAMQRSTLWIKFKKSNFDIDKTFRALKMICYVVFISSHWKATECWLYFARQIKLKGRFSNLLRLTFALKFTCCSFAHGGSFHVVSCSL